MRGDGLGLVLQESFRGGAWCLVLGALCFVLCALCLVLGALCFVGGGLK
jgi:hypothetical protein